jgi:hypothetical protein
MAKFGVGADDSLVNVMGECIVLAGRLSIGRIAA